MFKISKYSLQLIKEQSYDFNITVKNPDDMVQVFNDIVNMDKQAEEIFCIVCFNVKNQITGVFEVSRGGLSSSIVHPREVFKRALLNNAAAILLAHNHPSGNPEPSLDDIKITKRLMKAGKLLNIEVLDHLIIGDEKHCSLKERQDI